MNYRSTSRLVSCVLVLALLLALPFAAMAEGITVTEKTVTVPAGVKFAQEQAEMEYSASAAKSCVSIKFLQKKITVEAGSTAAIPGVRIKYRGGYGGRSYEIKNGSVACFYNTSYGTYILGVKPGTTKLTVKCDGKKGTATIKVTPIQVQSVSLSQTTANMGFSSTLTLAATVSPSNASNQSIKWSTSNKKIATVKDGVVTTKKKAGTVKITAKSNNGKKAVCEITVTPTVAPVDPVTPTNTGKYRALLIGMSQAFNADGFRADALGSAIEKEQGRINGLFSQMRYGGEAVSVQTLMNGTKAAVMAKIRSAFAGSAEDSVNFLYISTHGITSGGTFYFLGATDLTFTANELRTLLDAIPGKFVIFMNTCESGGAIGKSAAKIAAKSFVNSFMAGGGAVAKTGELAAAKYNVICAAKSTENGLIWGDEDIFAYSVCDAAGWSYDSNSATGSWNADASADGKVTMAELTSFLPGKVDERNHYYQSRSSQSYSQQTVVTYAADQSFVVFAK